MVFRVFGTLVALWLMPLTAQGLTSPLVLSAGADGVQRALVIVDSYRFAPDHLIVTADVPVELTLKGVTWLVPHNFVLEAAATGVTIRQEVLPGRTVTVRFTPTATGRFTFACDKQLLFFKSHEARGMVGTLEVLGPGRGPAQGTAPSPQPSPR